MEEVLFKREIEENIWLVGKTILNKSNKSAIIWDILTYQLGYNTVLEITIVLDGKSFKITFIKPIIFRLLEDEDELVRSIVKKQIELHKKMLEFTLENIIGEVPKNYFKLDEFESKVSRRKRFKVNPNTFEYIVDMTEQNNKTTETIVRNFISFELNMEGFKISITILCKNKETVLKILRSYIEYQEKILETFYKDLAEFLRSLKEEYKKIYELFANESAKSYIG